MLAQLLSPAPSRAQSPAASPLTQLSLEELARIEVTSVSRYGEPLANAPASVYVITADDLRRSGAATLAEALRLAPNLQVARIDAGQYAISARGFNGLAANKLLVLLDGRTLYTPLFSGVFWDQQDVLLEDVERIEIISGPGGTLWGTNAVNGVITITTRHARDSLGTLATGGAGTRLQTAAVRHGFALRNNLHARAYGKVSHFESSVRADGQRVRDDRAWYQAGFRIDGGNSAGAFTLQGDAHHVESEDRGTAGAIPLGRARLMGQNLLFRWRGQPRQGAELSVQAYVDHARRDERILFQPQSLLADVELQHALRRGDHHLVSGAGYRYGRDEVADGFLVGFRPVRRSLDWANAYLQDTWRLRTSVDLTFGWKFERNDYTGWEHLPSVRGGWTLSDEHFVWAGASRAVRAPARFDRDVIRPAGGVSGGPGFLSEVAAVWQVGYRGRTAGVLSWSVTAYRHEWDRLRSGTAPPVVIENRIEGPVSGVEAWGAWEPHPRWRVSGGVTAFDKALVLEPGSTDRVGTRNPQLANDPGHQWILRSSHTFGRRHDADVYVRHVGSLPTPVVPAYLAVNARYAWRVRPSIEISVVGQNLFDRSHPEFNALPGRSEFERGALLRVTWHR